MPRISLTDLVDLVSASGTPKATKVKRIKHRGPYSPAKDFYRPLRHRIVEAHENGGGKAHVSAVLGALTDPKKQTNYPAAVSGYVGWWGTKSLPWFAPPTDVYSASGVDVSVNPELGLEVGGHPHLIKLYFKADKLTKLRVDLITNLMEVTLGGVAPAGTTMSVLDVRNGKLFTPPVPNPILTAMVNAELAYLASLWPAV